MRCIKQGRVTFEVDASSVVGGCVRLIIMNGEDGRLYTITAQTAMELGEALIAQAKESLDESIISEIYHVGDDVPGADVVKLSVGSRVIWKGPEPGIPMTIAEIKSERDVVNGEIVYRFRAVSTLSIDGHPWRRLSKYRPATPEDEKRGTL